MAAGRAGSPVAASAGLVVEVANAYAEIEALALLSGVCSLLVAAVCSKASVAELVALAGSLLGLLAFVGVVAALGKVGSAAESWPVVVLALERLLVEW